MKSGGQMAILAAFIFLSITVTARSQSFSLLSAAPTNSFAQTHEITNIPPWIGNGQMEAYSNAMAPHDIYGANYRTSVVPLIKFEDVPLSIAFENLARQDYIKYLLDPQIDPQYPDSQRIAWVEPVVTKKWIDATATYAFLDICTNWGFKVFRDPEAGVILVRNRSHDVNFVTPDFYGDDTNMISLIEFRNVRLSIVLKNLAKQIRLKCIFSPQIDPWQLGYEPQVNIGWENLTARQAFAALCENYDLSIVEYPGTGIIRVEPAN